jgi:agmatine/peptidylarginine deiminase
MRPPRLRILLLLFLLPSVSRGQTRQPSPERTASDVVILSLESLNPRADLRQQVRAGLVGSHSEAELNAEKHLLAIQMNIVRETARFGPVLLLAPDETTMTAMYQRCQQFEICGLLKSDQVRVKVVAHDGVWIRDFGPQMEVIGDTAHVVHWRYFDIRTEEAKREKLQELEVARLELLEARQQEDQPDALTEESNPEARKAAASTIDDRLYVLREYSQILNQASPQRTNDENSAFDIADAVLADADFNFKTSALALDGGNLFKLQDGRCLTTRVLLSRNKDRNINVDEELQKIGGCKQVTYLDPLPGNVLEHIDLFALPVDGKRMLLASYDLSGPFAMQYWGQLGNAERDLAMNADVVMRSNAEKLQRLGYEVILVPSPFPRIPPNGHAYYPSLLNALVREGTDGSRQLVLPTYEGYEMDLQRAAFEKILAVFGPKTQMVTVEATEAAKSQGAIHCLTLTAPLRLSIFGDPSDAARRSQALAQKEQLDRNVSAGIAAQIPTTGLQGSWAILEKHNRSEETPRELYPQRIFFSASEFQKGVFDQLESTGKYTVDKKDRSSWSLRFQFPDQRITAAVVQWIGRDEVKLIFADNDSAFLLKRIASDSLSPFKRERQPWNKAGQ